MDREGEIRIGGEARTLEEEEGLQMAVAILQLNRRLRKIHPSHGPGGPAIRPPKPVR